MYGDYPASDDNAWFIQINCEIDFITPEQCNNSLPLTWYRDETALKAYMVKRTSSRSNTFDLNNWSAGAGGEWQNWYVINGMLKTSESDRIHCQPSSAFPSLYTDDKFNIYPCPFQGGELILDYPDLKPQSVCIFTMDGTPILRVEHPTPERMLLQEAVFPPGVYVVHCRLENRIIARMLVVP